MESLVRRHVGSSTVGRPADDLRPGRPNVHEGTRGGRPTFQTRARRTIVLARIDIAGKAHRNLDNYPHRPGQRFTGVHIHIYREGFGDRVAYLPEDLTAFRIPQQPHDLDWLTAFLDFCNIIDRPAIQTVM